MEAATFVKAFNGVVSQSHEELCGPAEAEGQSSAGLSRLLHQAKSAPTKKQEDQKNLKSVSG